MTIAFVHSGFQRVPGDEYQTIDLRCVAALLASWDIHGPIWEPCAPNGSLIAQAWPYAAHLGTDALSDLPPARCRLAVTNPPYTTKLCVTIVTRLRDLVASGTLDAAALLMRSQWDHAQGRAALLDKPPFAALVRLRFRPWWSESRKAQPIHSYQWLIFDRRHVGEPVVRYWPRAA